MGNKVISVACIFGFLSISLKAQTVDAPYLICTWKGDALSAISYTWDDNTAKQLSDALPLFDKYGFKVTIFTLMSANPDWNKLRQASSNGHEIASHTLTHTALNTLADSVQEQENKDSQLKINTEIGNTKCITFAYPYCTPGNKSITSKYYISARGCNGQVENKTPADFLNVGSIVCGPQGIVSTATQFNDKVNNACSSNGWTVYMLHGIDNDGGYSPVDSAELSKHLQYVNANADKFWVNTYGNVVRYIKERDAANLHETVHTDSLIIFSVTHNLDTAIYNMPISIKRPIPDGWTDFTVSQNGILITPRIVEDSGKKYLLADVLPNTGNIFLRKKVSAGIADTNLVSTFIVYPQPASTSIHARFTLKKASHVSLELTDGTGRNIRSITNSTYTAGLHELLLDITDLREGIFYCVLQTNRERYARKIIIDK